MTPDEVLPTTSCRGLFQQADLAAQRNIFAGPFMNFVAAVVILFAFIQVGGIQKPSLTIAQVVKGSPAAAAGLQVGDRLIAAKRRGLQDVGHDDELLRSASAQEGAVDLPHALRHAAHGGSDAVDQTGRGRSGLPRGGPKTTASYPAPWRAVGLAVTQSASLGGAIFKGLWLLVSGKINPVGPNGAAGPVGIISISQTAVRQSWYPVLLAFISVNLGIFNLLPFLPFDGGHIFFNVMERVRGRRVSTRVLERAIAIGVVLLITLGVLLTYNDLHRIFHFG